MTLNRISRAIRHGALLLTIATLGTLAAAPASAADVLADTGVHGAWSLLDTPAQPAADCDRGAFDEPDIVGTLLLQKPVVYARDRTANVDRQRVSYTLRIMKWNGTKWIKPFPADAIKGWATETKAATWNVPEAYPMIKGPIQARVIIRWYAADRVKVLGRVALKVRYYLEKDDLVPTGDIQEGMCQLG